MTRKEAIKRLKRIDIRDALQEDYDALDIAIEALEQEQHYKDLANSYEKTINKLTKAISEQEHCKDCISRQDAIDTIENWLSCDGYNEAERHIMRAMQSVLHDLPSADPQEPKTGRLSNKEWVDFLTDQFAVSRTSAKEMLHAMMSVKKEDTFKKQFSGGYKKST